MNLSVAVLHSSSLTPSRDGPKQCLSVSLSQGSCNLGSQRRLSSPSSSSVLHPTSTRCRIAINPSVDQPAGKICGSKVPVQQYQDITAVCGFYRSEASPFDWCTVLSHHHQGQFDLSESVSKSDDKTVRYPFQVSNPTISWSRTKIASVVEAGKHTVTRDALIRYRTNGADGPLM